MASRAENIFQRMYDAKPPGSAQYFDPGQYLLEVSRAFYKLSSDGTNREFLVFEFKVLESSNPSTPVGSIRSENAAMDKQGWEGRVQSLIVSMFGVHPKSAAAQTEDMRRNAATIVRALVEDNYRVQQNLPENFLAGKTVRGEGYPYETKAKKEIVAMRWSPA